MSWDNTSPAPNTLTLTPSNTAPSPATVAGFTRPIVAFAASVDNVEPFPVFDIGDNTFDCTEGGDGVAGKTEGECLDQLFLLKDQTDATHNGLWIFGSGGFVRSPITLTTGLQIGVAFGTVNTGKLFQLTTVGTIVLETTALTFVEVVDGSFPAAPHDLA